MLDTIKAYKTPIGVVLTLFGPQILRKSITYYNTRNRHGPSSNPSSTPRPQALSGRLKLFLALHTLYHLSHLLIPPFDLFSTPYLPVLAPNDILRSRLYPSAGGNPIHSGQNPLLDLLLTRLQNLDSRILYIRYGHTALQGCLWCRTPLDYLVANLPDILSRYLLAAVMLVIMGSESLAGSGASRRGSRWGGIGVWILAAGCLGEVGVRYLWDLRISKGDTLHVSPSLSHLPHTKPVNPRLSGGWIYFPRWTDGAALPYDPSHTNIPPTGSTTLTYLPPCRSCPSESSSIDRLAPECSEYTTSNFPLARDRIPRRSITLHISPSWTDRTGGQECRKD